jgi:hypothetical protein
MAADTPFSVPRTSTGKDSDGRMKVVELGPKLLKKQTQSSRSSSSSSSSPAVSFAMHRNANRKD